MRRTHTSQTRCAEHGAINAFFKQNPSFDIGGSHSYAFGQLKADRKASRAPGPQRAYPATDGIVGSMGCEDHLKACRIIDLVPIITSAETLLLQYEYPYILSRSTLAPSSFTPVLKSPVQRCPAFEEGECFEATLFI